MSTWNLRAILIGTAAVFGLLFIGVIGWFFVVTQNLPSEDELANYEPPIMSRVHAGDGKLVAEFATQHRVYVPSEELPDQLVQAFISAEDKTFFEHSGIDLWGMFRGTVINALQGKRITGGSTITQQVVKNMLVGDERSIDRKVREAVLAMRIEKKLSKEQILELYMNEIYLGGRSYGVGAAALNYFGKSLGQLTLAESAMLAGLPQAPGKVNPYTNPEAAIERRNYVLGRMVANGYVDKAEGDKAIAEPLKVVNRLDTDENQAAAYYVEELRKEILALGDQKKLEGIDSKGAAEKAFLEGGLSIRSTLDSNLQLIAQTALRAGLETYDRRHGWRGRDQIPAGRGSADAVPLQHRRGAALLLLDLRDLHAPPAAIRPEPVCRQRGLPRRRQPVRFPRGARHRRRQSHQRHRQAVAARRHAALHPRRIDHDPAPRVPRTDDAIPGR